MVREVFIDESYQTTRLFDEMKKGDILKIPFEKSRHSGIKAEAARRNKDERIRRSLSKMDIAFRVSEKEYSGFTTIYRLK